MDGCGEIGATDAMGDGREDDKEVERFRVLFPEGILLWAKLRAILETADICTSYELRNDGQCPNSGFSFWPAVVTVDPMQGLTVVRDRATIKCHVHFIGYENQRAWVPLAHVLEFNGLSAFETLGKIKLREAGRNSALSKKVSKDYIPSKRLRAAFDRGVKEAEEVLELDPRDRLGKLGYVYVRVPEKVGVKTKAARKVMPKTEPADDGEPPPKKKKVGRRKKQAKIEKDTDLASSPVPRPVYTPPPPIPPLKIKVERNPNNDESIYDFNDEEDDNEDALSFGSRLSDLSSKLRVGIVGSNGLSASSPLSSVPTAKPVSPTKTSPNLTKHKRQPANKQKRPRKQQSTPQSSAKKRPSGLLPPLPEVHVSAPWPDHLITDLNGMGGKDEFDSDDEEDKTQPSGPKLGELIWGRMPGFSYWPCFVTKSPDGEHRRDKGSAGRVEFHVQFFNWNDESGWISRHMSWTTAEEFKQKANQLSRNKSTAAEWRAWHPGGTKGVAKKWEAAVEIAQSTANMTRRERHDRFVVFYNTKPERGEMPIHLSFLKPHPQRTPKPAKRPRKRSRTKQQQPQSQQPKKRRKACPKRFKSKDEKIEQDQDVTKFPPVELPPGWIYSGDGDSQITGPDGAGPFESVGGLAAHLFGQNTSPPEPRRGRKRSLSFSVGDSADKPDKSEEVPGWFLERSDAIRNPVEEQMTDVAGTLEGAFGYHRDLSLPAGWLVKNIRRRNNSGDDEEERLYVSPVPPDGKEAVFGSKVEVARYLEPKGHPALELEDLVKSAMFSARRRRDLEQERERTIADSGYTWNNSVSCAYTVNVSKCNAEDIIGHPVLGKTVLPCYVEMVALPDVFLEHPTVSVQETPEEITITDVETGDFIAKKIMYE